MIAQIIKRLNMNLTYQQAQAIVKHKLKNSSKSININQKIMIRNWQIIVNQFTKTEMTSQSRTMKFIFFMHFFLLLLKYRNVIVIKLLFLSRRKLTSKVFMFFFRLCFFHQRFHHHQFFNHRRDSGLNSESKNFVRKQTQFNRMKRNFRRMSIQAAATAVLNSKVEKKYKQSTFQQSEFC